METGYKIVKTAYYGGQYNGYLSSIFARNKASVQYKPNEWALPPSWVEKGAPLMVFESWVLAANYNAREYPHYQIWECEYEPTDEKPAWDIDRLCEGEKEPFEKFLFPEGTRFAKRVKLVKRLI
jgi:hypothetical protein